MKIKTDVTWEKNKSGREEHGWKEVFKNKRSSDHIEAGIDFTFFSSKYIFGSRFCLLRFFTKLWTKFPHGTQIENVQNKIYRSRRPELLGEAKIRTCRCYKHIWISGSIHQTGFLFSWLFHKWMSTNSCEQKFYQFSSESPLTRKILQSAFCLSSHGGISLDFIR